VIRARWEYLSIVVVMYAESTTRPKSGTSDQENHTEYQQKVWLFVHSQDPQQLYHWSRDESEQPNFNFLALFNELGEEGWELISQTVSRSGINLHQVGWSTASEPLRTTYMFKRPAD